MLLGMKKRGFGEGRWNGFGGKVDQGETVEEAARRELKEEVGIEAVDLNPAGVMEFTFEDDTGHLQVHVFKVTKFSGEPVETEEMRPQWFARDNIPFDQMWPDDRHWFPHLLDGVPFQAHFHLDKPASSTYTPTIIFQKIEKSVNIDNRNV